MMKLSSRMYRFIVPGERRSLSLPFRRTGVVLRCVACCGALCGLLSACSIALPVGGLFDDDALTTQSVAASGAARLSPEITPDDWAFASIALATALDPLGSGDIAPWANPRTGIRGDFTAAGKPYLQGELVCRGFRATLNYQGRTDRLDGSACRMPDGQWATREASPA